jgi:syndecan 4
VRSCPKKCNSVGICDRTNPNEPKCVCPVELAGIDCSEKRCPDNCSNHGKCLKGECICNAGWEGPNCMIKSCLNDCHKNGVCKDGICQCNKGFIGLVILN